jgi:hypothetical protein
MQGKKDKRKKKEEESRQVGEENEGCKDRKRMRRRKECR